MAIRKPIFVLPVPLIGLSADSAGNGHPVDNLAEHKAIGLTWQSGSYGDHWIRGQFTGPRAIDFCALVSANAQPDTQVRLRLGSTMAQVDGSAPYDSGALPFISPAISREDGLYHSHLELPSPVTANAFRLDITGHSGPFEASMLVLGQKVEPSRFYNWDREFGVKDLGSGEFTSWGVFNEQPGIVMRTIDFTLGWQSETEFEASFRPMIEQLGIRQPLYLVFDPEPHAARQAKTYMGMLSKPGFARGTRRPGFTQDFSILSMI